MAAWTSEELTRIETADKLQIASPRRDGTLRNPGTIWSGWPPTATTATSAPPPASSLPC
jgi:hypothetical protein